MHPVNLSKASINLFLEAAAEKARGILKALSDILLLAHACDVFIFLNCAIFKLASSQIEKQV